MALLLPEGQVLFGCSVMGHENADMFAFKDGQFLDGFDGKAMANSQMLPNHYIANDHGESNVYFRNVKIYDKSQKLISKFEVEKINHECIFGTNAPRYYTPAFDYSKINNNILLIRNDVKHDGAVSELDIIDNHVTEYDINGNVLWDWCAAEHIDQLGLNEKRRKAMKKQTVNNFAFGQENDWIHLNTAIALGENKWYDEGDERFHPENIMICSRSLSAVYIIDKKTKDIVYTLKGREGRFRLQHYAHLIPKGLPGEGNILLLNNHSDNDPCIIEINPITKEVVHRFKGDFTSKAMGSVQKLVDGSYLIGCSNGMKVVQLDAEGKLIGEELTLQPFYRVNAYPKEWLV